MDTYNIASQRASKAITQAFSTSFSSAIRLFSKDIQQDIYNIYGLVRIADEIVDSYKGKESARILNELEKEVYRTIEHQFSSNVVVHAFSLTANQYSIDKSLIESFFQSMRDDLTRKNHNTQQYEQYIYGSAQVVGLMCLKVFTKSNTKDYEELKEGAMALGSAFQKVNFLRDISDDYKTRGRYYFPGSSYEEFDDDTKSSIVEDIKKDFALAKITISQLPTNSRFATQLAYDFYIQLLKKLDGMSAKEILEGRVSVDRLTKAKLLAKARLNLNG